MFATGRLKDALKKKKKKKKKGNWTKRDLSCTKLVTFKIKQVDNSLQKVSAGYNYTLTFITVFIR